MLDIIELSPKVSNRRALISDEELIERFDKACAFRSTTQWQTIFSKPAGKDEKATLAGFRTNVRSMRGRIGRLKNIGFVTSKHGPTFKEFQRLSGVNLKVSVVEVDGIKYHVFAGRKL